LRLIPVYTPPTVVGGLVTHSVPRCLKLTHAPGPTERQRHLGCCASWVNNQAREDRSKQDRVDPYEVKLISPPAKSLGMHLLPHNTQCGETVEVQDQAYIVSRVTYVYKLSKGKYARSSTRLDVTATGRYIINRYLNDLLDAKPKS